MNLVSTHRTCAATFCPVGYRYSLLATWLSGHPSFPSTQIASSATQRRLYEVTGGVVRYRWGSEERVDILVAFGVMLLARCAELPSKSVWFLFVGWCKASKSCLTQCTIFESIMHQMVHIQNSESLCSRINRCGA